MLRPNDLILLKSNPGVMNDEVELRDRLKRSWRQAQHLANVFWRKWRREYLPLLQVRGKWTKVKRDITKGDVVILSDWSAARGTWPRGVVEEVVLGSDRHVRQAIVRTSSGCVKRDVRSLSLLEASVDR